MKLINEKGKLFGIINVVDLIVLLVIVLGIAGVAVKLLGTQATDVVAQKVDCYAEVVVVGAAPRLYDEVFRQDLVGERMVASNVFLDSTVEAVWLEDYVVQVQTADGPIVDSKDPTKKNIAFVLKFQVAPDSSTFKIGSQEVRAGRTLIIKTQAFETNGIIRYVQVGGYDWDRVPQ